MIEWIAIAAIILVALFMVGRSIANAKFVARPLLELARIEAPARLESRPADETPERVLFRFDYIDDSFSMMGSSTPIRERLVVAAWAGNDSGGGGTWDREFRSLAAERVEDPAWRQEGDLEIGHGLHRVNMHETPAWVLIRTLRGQRLKFGYMVWQKDASLDEAKATLDRIAASFKPAMDVGAFFAIVRERPAKLRAERRGLLAEQLALRGVKLSVGGAPVERDGIIYHLSDTWRGTGERLFFAMAPIGTLPSGPRPFRLHRPTPPKEVGVWPDILYFARAEGIWRMNGIGADYDLPPALAPALEARHDDPTRAYFYAVKSIAVDEVEPREFGLDRFWNAVPAMTALLSDGKLVFMLK